jgi:hypothetical protein
LLSATAAALGGEDLASFDLKAPVIHELPFMLHREVRRLRATATHRDVGR